MSWTAARDTVDAASAATRAARSALDDAKRRRWRMSPREHGRDALHRQDLVVEEAQAALRAAEARERRTRWDAKHST